MKEIPIKSSLPYYFIGVTWLIISFIFPMYRISSIFIALVISIFAFVLGFKFVPSKKVLVPIKVTPTGEETADNFLKKANDMVFKLKNMEINEPIVKAQVLQIADTLQKISDFIKEHPNKARVLSSFTDYYLPTTMKLLDSYNLLDLQNNDSKNINESKENIKTIMPTMVIAFNNQLDALFYDKSMDIKAEVAVLNDLLKKQGLV